MNRKDFVKTLAFLPLMHTVMNLKALEKLSARLEATQKMPALFLGHGSPMNAIEENEFVQGFRNIGKELPKPKAILCISAHWETKGTYVTAAASPKTIHDFWGFPDALYSVQYPAPGYPELAKQTQQLVKKTSIGLDQKWGLDHGVWSVIKHLYPNADVPVIQMSIDQSKDAQYHYDLAKELAVLREKGVLIIGSGNIVHNLGRIAWNKMQEDNYAFDWATEVREKTNKAILSSDHKSLINYRTKGAAFSLAIPTPEHYLPLLYVLALQDKTESVELFNDKAIGGSLTMTSVKIE